MPVNRRTKIGSWRGTGGSQPHFKLSEKSRQAIIDLFKRNTLNAPSEFISKIENSVKDCLFFAKMDEEYSSDQIKSEFKLIAKHSAKLIESIDACNKQTLNYINQVNYQNYNDFLFTNDFKDSLGKLVSASNLLATSKKQKHPYIHGLTSAIAACIQEHSNYSVYDGPGCKLLQVMTRLLPELEKTLRRVLITDTVERFSARSLVQHYLNSKHSA